MLDQVIHNLTQVIDENFRFYYRLDPSGSGLKFFFENF